MFPFAFFMLAIIFGGMMLAAGGIKRDKRGIWAGLIMALCGLVGLWLLTIGYV